MRISMQILADRLHQNYPDFSAGKMADEMNLKRPLLYQSGMEFKKNKVYVAREADITEMLLDEHGDNLLLIVGMRYCPEENRIPGVCFFRMRSIQRYSLIRCSVFLIHMMHGTKRCRVWR